jgi:hypothetical protein
MPASGKFVYFKEKNKPLIKISGLSRIGIFKTTISSSSVPVVAAGL